MDLYKHILVTGGCGFIGSNFLNYMVDKYPSSNFYNIDKMDYCAKLSNVTVSNNNNYNYFKCDINNKDMVTFILEKYNIDIIIHFAAQSHVDNSFDNSLQYTIDNIMGTHVLLDCSRVYGKLKKFIHISTDEVYGEVDINNPGCQEKSVLNPTNPYAATKAAAEMLVNSYAHSYKLPTIITRSNNVYGPNQYPEKLIPKFYKLLSENKKLTIHGIGNTRRNFIHVCDVSVAIETILLKGQLYEIYNIGTTNEFTVLEIAEQILNLVKPGEKLDDWIEYVTDRPFNDFRYHINCDKLTKLGWREIIPFNVSNV